ncbi:HlyD family efflux transporter periplasmic adaptor subunit [bacterium]|nr:HlyD family efflux transporter periplasmic adaptor subunit [bacterium]
MEQETGIERHEPPTQAERSRTRRGVIAFAGVALAFSVALGFAQATQSHTTQGPALTGVVEGTEIDLAFKLPGRVAAVTVREGDTLKAGQEVARLTSEEVQAKLEQAEGAYALAEVRAAQARQGVSLMDGASSAQVHQAQAAVQAANAQLDAMRNGARPEEVAQLEAKLRASKTGESAARVAYEGIKELYQAGGVAKAKHDEALAQYDKLRAEREATEEQLRMARKGARQEQLSASRAQVAQASAVYDQAMANRVQVSLKALDVAAAEAGMKQAKGLVDEAQAALRNTHLFAPVDGVVKTVAINPGELVPQGGLVVTVEDVRARYVKFYVDEQRLAGIRAGERQELYVPAMDRRVAAKVLAVSPSADFAVRKATRELGERDVRAFTVKLRVEEPELLPGYTVEWQPRKEKVS